MAIPQVVSIKAQISYNNIITKRYIIMVYILLTQIICTVKK